MRIQATSPGLKLFMAGTITDGVGGSERILLCSASRSLTFSRRSSTMTLRFSNFSSLIVDRMFRKRRGQPISPQRDKPLLLLTNQKLPLFIPFITPHFTVGGNIFGHVLYRMGTLIPALIILRL